MSVKSQSSIGSSKIKRNAPSTVSDDCHEAEYEMDEKGVIKRKSRNLSEKKRRDQFNILINELCSMVCTGKRKMDKSAVLKTAISFIRNHNQTTIQSQSKEVPEDWKPSFLSNEEFTHLMLEALDEFIIVFSASGKILYVSENITCLLGHAPSNLIGSSIFDLVWEKERDVIQSLLKSWAGEEMNHSGKDNHTSLSCHLRRGNISDTSPDENNYELVFFSGYYRMQGNPDASRVTMSSWGDDSKESTNCADALSQHNGLVFVASARLQTPQLLVEMSIVDVSKSEFTSRHSLEWKFLFLDHRGPPIIGYLPFEVLGTSGYDYYHIDDLEKVSECHETLMQKGEVTSCCYRFLTKGQQWVWLKTKYYITYHQWYSKPEFIVCSHRVLSYNEVMGHQLVKLENEDTVQDRNTDDDIPASIIMNSKAKPEEQGRSSHDKLRKPTSHSSVKDRRLSSEDDSYSSRNGRPRSNSSPKVVSQRNRSHQSQRAPANVSEPNSPISKTPLLRQPYLAPGTESASSQHSSRVGAGFSDTGSVSSAGSFQSAASQHSLQSDQSMHSFHSQQSHHSMQSVHNQQTHEVPMRSAYQPGYGSSMNAGQQHLYEETPNYPPHPPHFSIMNYGQPKHPREFLNGPSDVETYLSTPKSLAENASGHQFLQPRVSSGTAARRNAPGTAECGNLPTGNSLYPIGDSSNRAFAYLTDEESPNPARQGVAVHQRLLEGFPVVPLPGLVAHEVSQIQIISFHVMFLFVHLQPAMMSAAQKELHEQLKEKHYQLQRQIASQQNELRRISEQLILSQYGAWNPTVIKMAVPCTESNGAGLTATDAPSGFSQGAFQFGQPGPIAISTSTPILVHSSEFQRYTANSEPISITSDSSQVPMRTVQQQENLVQLSQQDIQMLLAQNLLQDNQQSSAEYLS